MDNKTQPENDTVIIPGNYYRELLYAQRVLAALEAAGVDNWEWYGEAMEGIDDE